MALLGDDSPRTFLSGKPTNLKEYADEMTRDAKTRFYTTVKLGPNREKTPEGFLLCRNVAIARTGDQLYGRNSTPVAVGPDGFAVVSREADEVFRPETIESFNGKPVTNDHPAGDVTPANWRLLSKGTVLHPRRGEGAESDLLMADLLICDHEMIQLVLDGKEEVSCGYDADYVQTAVGRGKQVDIVGNHLAIVEAGRCGGRCSIKDHAETGEGVGLMKRFGKFADTLKKSFRDAGGDEKELQKALDNADVQKVFKDAEEGDATHVHVNLEGEQGRTKFTDDALDEKFGEHDDRLAALEGGAEGKTQDSMEKMVKDAVEAAMKARDAKDEDEDEEDEDGDDAPEDKKKKKTEDDEEDEDEDEDKKKKKTEDKKKTRDSASLSERFQETIAIAEILAPGIRVPTFDSAINRKRTIDSICALRKKALSIASDTVDGSEILTSLRRGKQLTHDALEQMSCSATRDLFYSAGATAKIAAVVKRTGGVRTVDVRTIDSTEPLKFVGGSKLTPAQSNAAAAAFWSGQSK